MGPSAGRPAEDPMQETKCSFLSSVGSRVPSRVCFSDIHFCNPERQQHRLATFKHSISPSLKSVFDFQLEPKNPWPLIVSK